MSEVQSSDVTGKWTGRWRGGCRAVAGGGCRGAAVRSGAIIDLRSKSRVLRGCAGEGNQSAEKKEGRNGIQRKRNEETYIEENGWKIDENWREKKGNPRKRSEKKGKSTRTVFSTKFGNFEQSLLFHSF